MRRWVFVCALLAAAGARAQAPPPDPDPWFSRDKALHFGLSGVFATGGYAVAYALPESIEWKRLLVGGGVSLTIGATKELLDYVTRTGTASWKDFTWDVAGAAFGLAVTWLLDHFLIGPLLFVTHLG